MVGSASIASVCGSPPSPRPPSPLHSAGSSGSSSKQNSVGQPGSTPKPSTGSKAGGKGGGKAGAGVESLPPPASQSGSGKQSGSARAAKNCATAPPPINLPLSSGAVVGPSSPPVKGGRRSRSRCTSADGTVAGVVAEGGVPDASPLTLITDDDMDSAMVLELARRAHLVLEEDQREVCKGLLTHLSASKTASLAWCEHKFAFSYNMPLMCALSGEVAWISMFDVCPKMKHQHTVKWHGVIFK